jgi:hypothetical protein
MIFCTFLKFFIAHFTVSTGDKTKRVRFVVRQRCVLRSVIETTGRITMHVRESKSLPEPHSPGSGRLLLSIQARHHLTRWNNALVRLFLATRKFPAAGQGIGLAAQPLAGIRFRIVVDGVAVVVDVGQGGILICQAG